MDFPALVRLLADVIPSPWQAARILRTALASLRKRGLTDDQLLASRCLLRWTDTSLPRGFEFLPPCTVTWA